MRRSERPRLGVIQYSNPEGGSGFIANPSLPWMSGFDITQESPVYDQETAWLRDSAQGSYTYYPQYPTPSPAPIPYNTTCGGVNGIGDLVLRRSDVVAPLPVNVSVTGRMITTV